MGFDIGFVRKIDWERPPRQLIEPICDAAGYGDGGTPCLSLKEIRELVAEFEPGDPDDWNSSTQDEVDEFLEWAEEYWRERGYDEVDGISLIYSY